VIDDELSIEGEEFNEKNIRSIIQTNLEHWKDEDSIPKSTTDILVLNSVVRSCNLKIAFIDEDWDENNLESIINKAFNTLNKEEVLNYQTIYHTIMIPNLKKISSRIIQKVKEGEDTDL